jgi:hypothetical protein
MSTIVNINPFREFWYQTSDKFWDLSRDNTLSDSFSLTNPGRVGIVYSAPDFIFFRLYLSFDLSVVPVGSTIDSITISLKRTDTIRAVYSPIITYAGNQSLDGDTKEYPLYIDNLNLDGDSLATIDIEDNASYYTSTNFTKYLISPGDILTLGVIDDYDFNNSFNSYSDVYLIDLAANRPILTVTYTGGGGGGYPNNVMGVSSANISSVRGVLSSNISKINVV